MAVSFPSFSSIVQNARGWLGIGADGKQIQVTPVVIFGADGLPVGGVGGFSIVQTVQPATPQLYRTGVTAIDQCVAAVLGATSAQAGGSLTANTYNNKVVAGNQYGRTTATAGTAVVTSAGNLTARIPITQVVGATFYDSYLSTDVDPKFVGRITEAQRATGCVITAAATGSAAAVIGAGSIAGAVDVQIPGTGGQAATTSVANFAWIIPAAAPVPCVGKQYVDFDLALSRAYGDMSNTALALAVLPFFQDTDDSGWYAPIDGVQALSLGGAVGGVWNPLRQIVRYEVRGRSLAHLLVVNMAPLAAGVSLDMRAIAS